MPKYVDMSEKELILQEYKMEETKKEKNDLEPKM